MNPSMTLSVITALIKVKLYNSTLKGNIKCSWKEFEKYTWRKWELNQTLFNFFLNDFDSRN